MKCLSSCLVMSHFGNWTSSITATELKKYVRAFSVSQEKMDVKMNQHFSVPIAVGWVSNMSKETENQ